MRYEETKAYPNPTAAPAGHLTYYSEASTIEVTKMLSIKNNMNKKHTGLLFATGLFALLNTPGFAQVPCKAVAAKITLAAGPLIQSLASLSAQTGCPVNYEKESVKTLRGNAVKGTLTPADALILVVRGTGLEAHHEKNTLYVSQVDQTTIAHKITILQAQLGQAVKSQKLTQKLANATYAELNAVRTSVVEVARKQGFVSAAEKASYQRTLAKAEQILASGK